MMLVACLGISLSLHEVLHRHIRFSYGIENDMHMDVACGVMTVRVGADDYLMSGKIPFCKIHGKRLNPFGGQTVFIPVPRVEAYNVMVGFDIFPILVFVKEDIGGFALSSKSEGVTAYALNQKFVTGYLISIFIENGFVGKLIVLQREVVKQVYPIPGFTCGKVTVPGETGFDIQAPVSLHINAVATLLKEKFHEETAA